MKVSGLRDCWGTVGVGLQPTPRFADQELREFNWTVVIPGLGVNADISRTRWLRQARTAVGSTMKASEIREVSGARCEVWVTNPHP